MPPIASLLRAAPRQPSRTATRRPRQAAQLGLLALLGTAGLPGAGDAAVTDPVWARWISTLESRGFSVTEGVPAVRDCATYISVFGNCLNSNPAGGYYDILPPVDDSYIDPCYNPAHDCSGATPNSFTIQAVLPDGSQASVNQFYRLGATDALVVIVNLPPNAAYFGYQSYVYSRPSSAYSVPGCLLPSGFADPCRTPVMGSVGNSINNVSILNQAGLSLAGGGSVAFITTPSQALYGSLSALFTQIGGSPTRLFAEPLAQKIIAGPYDGTFVPGTDSNADEISSLVRYSIPQDSSAANDWQSALTGNVLVYRVRNAGIASTQFAGTSLAAKHYSADETGDQQAVSELGADLRQWLQTQTKAKVSVSTMKSTLKLSKLTGLPLRSSVAEILGPYCLVKGTDCMRDTQDTDSYRLWVLPTSLTRTAAVIGVDSTQTGNATYISVGVTDYTILEGVAALSQTNAQATGFASGALTGSATDLVNTLSAAGLIPAPSATLAAALPRLFVSLVTRSCPAGATAMICSKPYTLNVDSTELPTSHQAQLTRRSYVHPGDANGPNPDFILPTQVVY